jgi:TonB family protein
MLNAHLLALSAAAVLQAAAPHTVTPLVVTPPPVASATLHLDGSDAQSRALMRAWPSRIYDAAQDGRVVLNCLVDRFGLAETCEIASEQPTGFEFGKVALEMRPLLKVARAPKGRAKAMLPIAVEFRTKGQSVSRGSFDPDGAMPPEGVAMLNNPVWMAAPTFADVARAYPARGRGEDGYAVLRCAATPGGGLSNCTVLMETPAGRGFGYAALQLKGAFRLDPAAPRPKGGQPYVDIPIRFPARGQRSREVEAPVWLSGFDQREPLKLFPPEAASAGLTAGRGVARCEVAGDGALQACKAERADPPDLGFSEAAVRLASTLKANLWSLDGAPVAGGVIEVGFQLKLGSRP